MRTDYRKKAQEGIRRLEGLLKKVHAMIDADEYCPHILENLLAMKGHIEHVQGQVLESHLHTCTRKKMTSPKAYDAFIAELVRTVGLGKR